MRRLLLVPVILAGAAMLGMAVVKLAGWPMHARELLAALAINLLAGEAAFAPLLLMQGGLRPVRDAGSAAQSALVGTLVQMMLALALMVAATSLGLIENRDAFVVWLLALYAAGLIAVVIGLAGAIRRAANTLPRAQARQDGPED